MDEEKFITDNMSLNFTVLHVLFSADFDNEIINFIAYNIVFERSVYLKKDLKIV